MIEPTLASLLTRGPRIFHKGHAAECLTGLDGYAPEMRDLIAASISTSPYLAGLLRKEEAWLRQAVEKPHSAIETEIQALACLAAEHVPSMLRQAKRRIALLTGLADLGGAWSLTCVTGALTRFADAATHAALKAGIATQIKRGKLPGKTEDDIESAAGMTVLAMGKMGAFELNYSSDIDLICLFDESHFDPADFQEARAALIKATRAMSATLNDITAEGYVFRTDLRLRPDPSVTPVCVGIEAAERYYESLGRTWERAAFIKARPCAGDLETGHNFLRNMRPFVWRKHLDFAAIQDAHDMRLAIRSHKGLGGPITLPDHNVKLGRGGIREIEFFTQTRQLIAGGRDESLRVRGTLEGLQRLAQRDWVPAEVADTLGESYEFLRMVEHRLQMVQDAQTHRLPSSETEFDRIAAMMDMDTQALKGALHNHLSAVHELTEGFFAASQTPSRQTDAHSFDTKVLAQWRSYPALRSARGAEIFDDLQPMILEKLGAAAKPDEALLAFDGFLSGLPAGVQLFSLLKANPQLTDLLVDIVAISPNLAAYLSRNAQVLDAVIGGDFFLDWPGQAGLTTLLQDVLAAEADYEAQLDAARRWAKEWHFRIGVHHLRGLTQATQAGRQYSDLARAVLTALWPWVIDDFSDRHGTPPGRGAAIVAMGSLGAGQLTAASDLDIIVIYDAEGVEASGGRRPLLARQYYARLTQALITAMTAPMAQGKLYDVDMRLRPSGNKGPVATSLASFADYQRNEAWMWEHLALTRATVIAGPDTLQAEIDAICREIVQRKPPKAKVLAANSDMRHKIAKAKTSGGPLDAKIGGGRLQDIELFAQSSALIAGGFAKDIPQGLAAAENAGLISRADLSQLVETYSLAWALQSATRLISDGALRGDALGQSAKNFLVRSLAEWSESDTLEGLEAHLAQRFAEADQMIAQALAPYDTLAERDD